MIFRGSEIPDDLMEFFEPANEAAMRDTWTLSPEPFTDWTTTSRRVPVAWDEADDDTMRTPSPDCPVHAWTGRSDPIRVGDERGGGASSRTSGSGGRRAPKRSSDSAPIVPNHGPATPGESWGSLPLLCAHAAMPHSNGTSKTDLAPATNPPCTPSVQTLDRTGDTLASRDSGDAAAHTTESRNGTGDSAAHQTPDTPSRTAHTFSRFRSFAPCTCSYHKIVTESISHFATFPTEIPRRAIKAGTSERGVCPACGAPWVRTTEKIRPSEYAGKGQRWGNDGNGMRMPDKFNTETITTGWAPSCACGGDPVPATVLDCFLGSGTTLLVADQLGRDGIGIELNPDYARMALNRIRGDAPLFAAVEVA